ncbi:MAG: helix-turn-helix transcriptional regulator [Halomonas sp.]
MGKGVEVLYVEDVEQRLRIPRESVRTLVRRGRLPKPGRIGRRLAWDREDFERWLESAVRSEVGA